MSSDWQDPGRRAGDEETVSADWPLNRPPTPPDGPRPGPPSEGPPAWGAPSGPPAGGPPPSGPPVAGPPPWAPPPSGPPPYGGYPGGPAPYPGGPYPGGPYPGGPYPGGSAPGGASGSSTAALVLSIIGFVIPILSIIALVLVRSAKRVPNVTRATLGRAKAAKIMGIIGVITSGLIIVGIVAVGVTVYNHSYTSLNTGDCFNRSTGSGGLTGVSRSSCSDPHDSQAVGRFDAPDGPYPGTAGLEQPARQQCIADAKAFVGSAPTDNLQPLWIVPTSNEWDTGIRRVLCVLTTADGSKVNHSFNSGS